jgi:hypothetical protein
VAEQFQRDVAHHQMKVLRDDGQYRHLLFNAPNTGFYWFELVTWPNHLAITGDMGPGYVFTRTADMFQFFRLHRAGINPGYWAEKLVADSGVREFSEEKFRQTVLDYAAGYADEYPGLVAAVRSEVLWGDDLDFEDAARDNLANWVYRVPTGDAEPAYKEFRFEDTPGWDLHDYTHRFLWCCHAIRWGIQQYDSQPVAPDPAAATRQEVPS